MRVGSRGPCFITLVLALWRPERSGKPATLAIGQSLPRVGVLTPSYPTALLALSWHSLVLSWRTIAHALQGHTQSQLIVYKREVPAQRCRQAFGDMHAAEPPTAR